MPELSTDRRTEDLSPRRRAAPPPRAVPGAAGRPRPRPRGPPAPAVIIAQKALRAARGEGELEGEEMEDQVDHVNVEKRVRATWMRRTVLLATRVYPG